MEIVVDFWGDFACFTPPYAKVERMTYPVPTPSAVRGMLSSIYSKPVEFYWQVKKIEVMKDIKYINLRRNEVKGKYSTKPVDVSDTAVRTQRQTVALRDVYYRITAEQVKRPEYTGSEEKIHAEAMRRIENGKCFMQPALGMREFVAFFGPPDPEMKPIDESSDFGLMVYDVFDLHKYEVSKKTKPDVSLYHCRMDHGVILVPDYDSPDVLKGVNI